VARKPEENSRDAEVVASFVHRFKLYNWPANCRLPELYYDRRSLAAGADSPVALHAKCIVVDDEEVFISSANFTAAAQERNVEVGLILCSRMIAHQAAEFFNALVGQGFCLRCM
jgi:phosphatidylserine/phosphatidylglycerophosphate/cardiolipin synthase-like enzyme